LTKKFNKSGRGSMGAEDGLRRQAEIFRRQVEMKLRLDEQG